MIGQSGLLISETLSGTAAEVIDAVRSLGLEGVIAKRRNSRYESGLRTGAWCKVKLDRQQEFVVGGYRRGPLGIDALVVGYHDGAGGSSRRQKYGPASRRISGVRCSSVSSGCTAPRVRSAICRPPVRRTGVAASPPSR